MKIIELSKKFISQIQKEGLKSALRKTKNYYKQKQQIKILNHLTYKNCGTIEHYPLVSLIAVNYNGENDLPVFLESILTQTYNNFELIIVDNNSTDNSYERIKEYQTKFNNTKIKYINSGKNLGFAAGNNYAMPYCNGEFYALINIDTKVDKDWLKELIDAISQDGTCGAVCSKTLFYERFQDIEFSSIHDLKLDIDYFIESLNYQKYFVRHGEIDNGFIHSKNNKIILSLPIQKKKLKFKILELSKGELLSVKIGKNKNVFYSIDDTILEIDIDFKQENVINSSYIINNAGSISINGMPGDRGIGEYDTGQYDSKQYVDFFCGVSVLLRRSLLVDRKIFISEFFAYYEDSELSRYIRNCGYSILYAPRSVLYHKHSTTSSEGSPLWHLLVSRSQKIYTYDGNQQRLFNEITKLEESYKEYIEQNIYNELKCFSKILMHRLSHGSDLIEKTQPIAIYNSYWNTKGGGESHALSFANFLQKHHIVYLISETDFDIKELSQYYNIDLSNCRKLIQSNITTDFTKRFYIFINSTYSSTLISKARKSYYIVSFPHKEITKEFLQSYTFLYNSDYTKRWADIYWGNNLKSKIIYPIGSLQKRIEFDAKKENIILSVGRFFVGNHCKNQLKIAKAFKLISLNSKNNIWKLVLIGSIDARNSETVDYLKKIKKELEGLEYEIITNASREVLIDYYQKSSIYVHATGLEEDVEKKPERFEHFGITPVEAMTYGCIPLVYSVGGPAELINKLKIGYTFGSISELKQQLIQLTNRKNNNNITTTTKEIVRVINKFLDTYSFENNLEFIISRGRND